MGNHIEQMNRYLDRQKALGINIFDFRVEDDKVILVKYHDNAEREEVTIPGFVDSTYYEKFDMNFSPFDGVKNLKTVYFNGNDTFKDMSKLFAQFAGMELHLDIDTSNVTGMKEMFFGCHYLRTLTLSNRFNTSNVIEMGGMFEICPRLNKIDLGDNFNTKNVINMASMFKDCDDLIEIPLGNKFYTCNVENMSEMFYGCRGLKKFIANNKFSTEKLIDMTEMFRECHNLEEIRFEKEFRCNNIASIKEAFMDCESLKSIDIEGFNPLNSFNKHWAFKMCNSLEIVESKELKDVLNMYRQRTRRG